MSIKFSKIHFITALVVCIIGYILALCSCGNKNNPLKDYTTFFASEYTIVSDDNCTVSVSAPDFQKIAINLIEETGETTVDSQKIVEYAKQHPEYTKDYILNVDECSEERIQKALLNQISYDLMVAAIQNIEYSERWDTE